MVFQISPVPKYKKPSMQTGKLSEYLIKIEMTYFSAKKSFTLSLCTMFSLKV